MHDGSGWNPGKIRLWGAAKSEADAEQDEEKKMLCRIERLVALPFFGQSFNQVQILGALLSYGFESRLNHRIGGNPLGHCKAETETAANHSDIWDDQNDAGGKTTCTRRQNDARGTLAQKSLCEARGHGVIVGRGSQNDTVCGQNNAKAKRREVSIFAKRCGITIAKQGQNDSRRVEKRHEAKRCESICKTTCYARLIRKTTRDSGNDIPFIRKTTRALFAKRRGDQNDGRFAKRRAPYSQSDAAIKTTGDSQNDAQPATMQLEVIAKRRSLYSKNEKGEIVLSKRPSIKRKQASTDDYASSLPTFPLPSADCYAFAPLVTSTPLALILYPYPRTWKEENSTSAFGAQLKTKLSIDTHVLLCLILALSGNTLDLQSSLAKSVATPLVEIKTNVVRCRRTLGKVSNSTRSFPTTRGDIAIDDNVRTNNSPLNTTSETNALNSEMDWASMKRISMPSVERVKTKAMWLVKRTVDRGCMVSHTHCQLPTIHPIPVPTDMLVGHLKNVGVDVVIRDTQKCLSDATQHREERDVAMIWQDISEKRMQLDLEKCTALFGIFTSSRSKFKMMARRQSDWKNCDARDDRGVLARSHAFESTRRRATPPIAGSNKAHLGHDSSGKTTFNIDLAQLAEKLVL
ncbi:hypothetical protein B0H11DRAFT_1915713 [Mycena galericulata]|nr:hypothetical protein B0H11DRAFT_1915713 [Mycena galericulata]